MKAAFIKEVGPPEKIVIGDLPDPQPGPGQYLVKVAAADVNRRLRRLLSHGRFGCGRRQDDQC